MVTILKMQTVRAANSSKRPVLLIHGFATSPELDWSELVPRLNRDGHDVIMVELPGHGDSREMSSRSSVPSAIVTGLVEIIDSQPTDVDVVGYSLGARLAFDLPHATGRLHKLVLGGLSPMDPFAHVDVEAVKRGVSDPQSIDVADGLTQAITSLVTSPGNDPDSLIDCITGLSAEPFDPRQAFVTPTLLVVGEQDEMAAGSAMFAAQLPHSTVVHVPGDHVVALHSEQFGDAVLDFLSA